MRITKNQSILFLPTISLILGIVSAYFYISLLILLGSATCLYVSFYKKEHLNKLSLVFIFLFIGYFAFIQQQLGIDEFDKITLGKNINIKANIDSITEVDGPNFKYCTTLTNLKLNIKNKWESYNTKIQIYTFYKPLYKINDLVIINNIKLQPIKNSDFKKYLTRINVANTFFTKKIIYKKIESSKINVKLIISQIKEKITNSIKSKMNSECFALFASIFLGNKKINKNEMERISHKFSLWGLPHLIARSGIHLLILIFIFQFLLSIVRNFIIKKIVLLFLISFFYVLSWPAIPFTRAFLTYATLEFCNIFNLEHDTLHIFLLICNVILINNPIELFFLDFQLSFLITYILLWYSRFAFAKNKGLRLEGRGIKQISSQ